MLNNLLVTNSIEDGSLQNPFIVSRLSAEEVFGHILSEHPEAKGILERQELVNVKYLDKSKQVCQGQMIVDRELAGEVKELFNHMLTRAFCLEKVIPIQSQQFNNDDETSMQANNSSAFNFRYVANTERLSLHAFGFALDINPRDNPLQKDGITLAPKGAIRDESNSETFTAEHFVVKWLEDRGWEWGGRWIEPYSDYHHFQKPLATEQYLQQLSQEKNDGLISEEVYERRLRKAMQSSLVEQS